jgi:hypothetical protein
MCLGYEMYFYKQNTSSIKYGFNEFKNILLENLANTGSENKETLKLLFSDIEKYIKEMD